MKLADFLQWEEPQQSWGSGTMGQPRIWLKKNLDKHHRGGYSFIINQTFLREHLPDQLKRLKENNTNTNNIGIAINVDRQKKILHIVFDPPKNVPQYMGKMYGKGSGTINITNKMLGDEVWALLDMPDDGGKQFFDFELLKEVEGRKVFKLTYDKESAVNTQALIIGKINTRK